MVVGCASTQASAGAVKKSISLEDDDDLRRALQMSSCDDTVEGRVCEEGDEDSEGKETQQGDNAGFSALPPLCTGRRKWRRSQFGITRHKLCFTRLGRSLHGCVAVVIMSSIRLTAAVPWVESCS